MTAKAVISQIWPDEDLANAMLCDAEQLVRESTSGSLDRAAAAHIRDLLARVRHLESERERMKNNLANYIDKIATDEQKRWHKQQEEEVR